MGGMTAPSADVSARVAWADDAPAIAAVQVRAWRTLYADLLPAEVLEALDPDDIAAGWRDALAHPADARNRVLVALERNLVTGFVVTGPSADPDCDPVATGELTDLTIDPHQRGAGHGSRLLQAGADTLVADRFTRAVTWLPAADDALRAFLTSAGWGPDGAHRTLDLLGDGSTTVKQVRLHTALVDAVDG
jgi:GNAT superfamily N-acetyltransferase